MLSLQSCPRGMDPGPSLPSRRGPSRSPCPSSPFCVHGHCYGGCHCHRCCPRRTLMLLFLCHCQSRDGFQVLAAAAAAAAAAASLLLQPWLLCLRVYPPSCAHSTLYARARRCRRSMPVAAEQRDVEGRTPAGTQGHPYTIQNIAYRALSADLIAVLCCAVLWLFRAVPTRLGTLQRAAT